MGAPKFEQISFVQAKQYPEEESEKLLTAMKNLGFIIITDIPGLDEDELLNIAKDFFGLAEESKMQIAKQVFNPKNCNIFRGYVPVIPGGHSLKEIFEIGNFDSDEKKKVRYTKSGDPFMQDVVEETNVWPGFDGNKEKAAEFKAAMKKYFEIMTSVAEVMTELFSRALKIDHSYFRKLCPGPTNVSTFRLIHYPPRNEANIHSGAIDPDDEAVLTTGAHVDTSFITILSTFQNPGLQVKYQSEWYDVPNVQNSLVMNIGKLLSHLTEEILVATNHRVIDIGQDRYSAPFFYEPCFWADLRKTIYGNKVEGLVANHYGPWMTKTTSQYAEYQTTNFGVAFFDD